MSCSPGQPATGETVLRPPPASLSSFPAARPRAPAQWPQLSNMPKIFLMLAELQRQQERLLGELPAPKLVPAEQLLPVLEREDLPACSFIPEPADLTASLAGPTAATKPEPAAANPEIPGRAQSNQVREGFKN